MGIITLGPQGTFSNEAAKLLFPQKKITFASTIDEIFFRLADPKFSEGIIPMETALSDFVEESIFNLMKYDFSLTKKKILPISYHLVGDKKEIKHLFASLDARILCRTSIHEKCPNAKVIETKNNAYSAIQYLANPEHQAAIVSPFLQKIHKLPILAENIEDDEENYVTFFAIGKTPYSKKKEKCASSFLLFSEELASITKQISTLCHKRKIPLLKLKHLVLQEGHTPLYFIEIEGHLEEKEVHALFEELTEKYLIKHLGSYPL